MSVNARRIAGVSGLSFGNFLTILHLCPLIGYLVTVSNVLTADKNERRLSIVLRAELVKKSRGLNVAVVEGQGSDRGRTTLRKSKLCEGVEARKSRVSLGHTDNSGVRNYVDISVLLTALLEYLARGSITVLTEYYAVPLGRYLSLNRQGHIKYVGSEVKTVRSLIRHSKLEEHTVLVRVLTDGRALYLTKVLSCLGEAGHPNSSLVGISLRIVEKSCKGCNGHLLIVRTDILGGICSIVHTCQEPATVFNAGIEIRLYLFDIRLVKPLRLDSVPAAVLRALCGRERLHSYGR